MTAPADSTQQLRALARTRGRLSAALTAAIIVIYFGFIILIAFNKPLLARKVTAVLSLGILLGALVIVSSWLLTWLYVRWANKHYDEALRAISSAGAPK